MAENPRDSGLQKVKVMNGPLEAPTVSVVVTTYNQAHFLGESIRSVLAQTCNDIEIIVVDDESSDDPGRVAREYGVSYIRQKNQGVAGARNTGLREVKGEFVVFLDADDRLLRHALETNLKSLDAYPECAFVFGHHIKIAGDGSRLGSESSPCADSNHYRQLLQRNYIGPPSVVMYRRSVFDSVGPLDKNASPADDYELYLRIARVFPIHCHHEVIVEYRVHSTNTSRNFDHMLKKALRVLHEQRRYVKGNKDYERALKVGVRNVRQAYGDQVVDGIRRRVRARQDWRQVARGIAKLLRHNPRDIAAHCLRKMRHVIFGKEHESL